MSIPVIFSFILFIGIIGLVIGVILMLLSFALMLFRESNFCKELVEKIFVIALHVLGFGLLIFLLALAGLGIFIAIEGIKNGEYNLGLSRTGGNTKIKWAIEPIRFTFQTAVFMGFSIWLIYFSIKQCRFFLKRK
ncbi:MAG: hypothetical protein LBF27_29560 [Sphingobacterium sp.]|jgi:hypothetical protein|nr:hypothetical protein [Sphingobacterium sp.]